MANTILLKGREWATQLERVAAGTITPGMLVEVTTADKLQAQSTTSVAVLKAFALEDDMNGKEISDNYVADDYVQSAILCSGAEVLAFLAAGGTAVAIGNMLEAAGDGSLKKFSAGVVVAQALEALDNSGGGSMARLKVRII